MSKVEVVLIVVGFSLMMCAVAALIGVVVGDCDE